MNKLVYLWYRKNRYITLRLFSDWHWFNLGIAYSYNPNFKEVLPIHELSLNLGFLLLDLRYHESDFWDEEDLA